MSEHKDGASHKPGHGGHEEEHEEHVNHEAWVIPYADMLTLLMALFLMLWATSSVDQQKFAALADSLRDAFGNGAAENAGILEGAAGVLDGQQSGVENGDKDQAEQQDVPDVAEILAAELPTAKSDAAKAQEALEEQQERAEAEAKRQASMSAIERIISERAEAEGVLDSLEFRKERRGLVVTVVADNVLFDSGSATLRRDGEEILSVVAAALRNVNNDVMIEGHTDNSPIATDRFPSNWELSSMRATTVLRYIVGNVGFPADRIGSTGYGETRPVASNSSADDKAKNRRVEVVVLNEQNFDAE